MNDVFIPWTEIQHPDFPGKKVEVGGLKPFVMINPPADTLGDLINTHYKFITAVAAMHPELEFLDITTEDAGENIFRLTLKIHNKGVFATCAEAGDQNIWTRIMRMTSNPERDSRSSADLRFRDIKACRGMKQQSSAGSFQGRGRLP